MLRLRKLEANMPLLVLIILGVVSVLVIWLVHECKKREEARAKEEGKQSDQNSAT